MPARLNRRVKMRKCGNVEVWKCGSVKMWKSASQQACVENGVAF